MANAMVALANLTLGSAQATVTFSSIPTTYRDLRLVITGLQSLASVTDSLLQVNSDSGSNYSRVYIFANNQGTTFVSGSDTSTGFKPFYVSNTGIGHATCDILDYSATDKHKTLLTRSNGLYQNENGISAQAQRWANTAAITTMALSIPGGNWSAGSTFALYGIVS